jgi:hypothetical protein
MRKARMMRKAELSSLQMQVKAKAFTSVMIDFLFSCHELQLVIG